MGYSAPRPRVVFRSAVILILLLLPGGIQAGDPVFTGQAPPPEQLLTLWYQRPAKEWLEALPIGNGRLGGMVYGGVLDRADPAQRRYALVGRPEGLRQPRGPQDAARDPPPDLRGQVRRGSPARQEDDGPVHPDLPADGRPGAGVRGPGRLDAGRGPRLPPRRSTSTAVLPPWTMRSATWSTAGRCSSSHPDQVMVVRLTASRPRSLAFTARLGSRLRFRTRASDGALVLQGKAPAHVDPSYYNTPNPIVYATG